MKRLIPCFFFLSCLLVTPLYAASETLTTYYPVPSGKYNKLQSNSLQVEPSTLSAVQAKYNCSFDPALHLSPCPAGLIYYDIDAQTLYVSAGTHWRSINSTCVPLTACSATLNCGNDSCGDLCGTCASSSACSSTTPNVPGTCA
jgi:hypothetical protein